MVNKTALMYLEDLINYYKHRRDESYGLVDMSYSAFLDYAHAKDFHFQLKNLYYKLTNKEYEE